MAYDYVDLKKDDAVYSKKYKRAYKGFSWTIFFFSYLTAFYRQDIKGAVYLIILDTIVFMAGVIFAPVMFPLMKIELMVLLFMMAFRIIYGTFYNRIQLRKLKIRGYTPY